MEPKDAILAAKAYVKDIFAADGAMNIGLEELRFDEQRDLWFVTIGFTRSWEGPQGVSRWNREGQPFPRTLKTVEIENGSGKIIGVRHWPVAA